MKKLEVSTDKVNYYALEEEDIKKLFKIEAQEQVLSILKGKYGFNHILGIESKDPISVIEILKAMTGIIHTDCLLFPDEEVETDFEEGDITYIAQVTKEYQFDLEYIFSADKDIAKEFNIPEETPLVVDTNYGFNPLMRFKVDGKVVTEDYLLAMGYADKELIKSYREYASAFVKVLRGYFMGKGYKLIKGTVKLGVDVGNRLRLVQGFYPHQYYVISL